MAMNFNRGPSADGVGGQQFYPAQVLSPEQLNGPRTATPPTRQVPYPCTCQCSILLCFAFPGTEFQGTLSEPLVLVSKPLIRTTHWREADHHDAIFFQLCVKGAMNWAVFLVSLQTTPPQILALSKLPMVKDWLLPPFNLP